MKEGNNNEKEHHLRNTSRRSVTCACVQCSAHRHLLRILSRVTKRPNLQCSLRRPKRRRIKPFQPKPLLLLQSSVSSPQQALAAMAISIAKSTSGMARQPEAAGKINSAMMLGLVFIETAIIYALIIAILIIFVL